MSLGVSDSILGFPIIYWQNMKLSCTVSLVYYVPSTLWICIYLDTTFMSLCSTSAMEVCVTVRAGIWMMFFNNFFCLYVSVYVYSLIRVVSTVWETLFMWYVWFKTVDVWFYCVVCVRSSSYLINLHETLYFRTNVWIDS